MWPAITRNFALLVSAAAVLVTGLAATGAVFYHLKLMNLTSKFGPNTGELLQEILEASQSGTLHFSVHDRVDPQLTTAQE